MRFDYDHVTNLEYKVRAQKLRIREFESGDRYTKLKKQHDAEIRKKDALISRLKKELASANARIITNRNHFMEAMEDVLKEKDALQLKMERKLKKEQECRYKAEARIDEVMDRLSQKQKKLDEAYERIEELEGRITKLTAQVNCNYENSSRPSSQCPNHKKIENSREKSDRPRGAQPGHKGHTAKLQEPTEEDIWIPDPEEFTQNPDQYKPTGDYVYHQVVGLRVELVVQQYCANLFLNRKTRQYVHAPFPEWAVNDVNYDGTVKAFAFILNNYCNVSIDKTRDLLSEITGGKLTISKGMINSLAREFSNKSRRERDELFDRLVKSYALHTDFTTAKINGNNVHVHLCGNEDGDILIQAREHKGHEGIKGTPVEHFLNTLVHDHDRTLYNYGSSHQECLSHVLRYLLASVQNETDLTWAGKMRELLRESIHYRKSLEPGTEPEPDVVADFERRYQEILDLAENEYIDYPPTKYYRDGYNLYKRMREYKNSHLLFLYDIKVPYDNNLAERLARIVKRKAAQVISFRSMDSLIELCDSLSILLTYSKESGNMFESTTEVFNRNKPA